jgi:hypothetical protein
MLEKLADEFRRGAGPRRCGKHAILRYDKVTLELIGATTVDVEAGARFWVLDLAVSTSHEETHAITVERTPPGLDRLAPGGIHFLH